jgi:putative transposase
MLLPIDSTIISLTNKIFWEEVYHQIKLHHGHSQEQENWTECLIHFGQGHDVRFAESINSMIPANGLWIMHRGFSCKEFLDDLSVTQTQFWCRSKTKLKQSSSMTTIEWSGFAM